jgi:hypothetical protein
MLDKYNTIEELAFAWRQAHKDETGAGSYLRENVPQQFFIPDGIICEEKYYSAKRKILFIAKEANWFWSDRDLAANEGVTPGYFWHRSVAFGEKRSPRTMFSNRVAMLANALLQDNYEEVNKTDYAGLQAVAFMNLNKRGGYAYCDWSQLNGYVQTYHSWIAREIELIAPDIIICCGEDVKWLLGAHNISIPNGTVLISLYHPSYFALSDIDYLNQLACAVKGESWEPRHKSLSEGADKKPIKGIIFDTNKTYSTNATFDMLTSGKISAYEDASRFVNSFNIDDYAFYYVTGKGVVAAGQIISDVERADFEGSQESYRMVKMLVPLRMPVDEMSLKAVSASELKRMFHGFFFAATTKRPYLTEEECKTLLATLESRYQE